MRRQSGTTKTRPHPRSTPYRNESEVVSEFGARRFAQARDLFIENLRNALPKPSTVVKGQSHLLAVRDPLPRNQAKFIRPPHKARPPHAHRCARGLAPHLCPADDPDLSGHLPPTNSPTRAHRPTTAPPVGPVPSPSPNPPLAPWVPIRSPPLASTRTRSVGTSPAPTA